MDTSVCIMNGLWEETKRENSKTNKRLLFEKSEEDVEKRERRICYTQSHALYGKDLKGKILQIYI